MENYKKRDVSIDLIKVVSMFMICGLHILGRGGILNELSETRPLSFMYFYTWMLKMVCYCGVNCFGIASGYIGVERKQNASSIIYIWIETLFYSGIITILFYSILPGRISRTDLLKSFVPLTSGQYWYFTSYFYMFICMPILNHLLRTTCKKQLLMLLMPIVIILPIPTTIFGMDPFDISWGYSGLWLCILYLIGGYIKLYKPMSLLSIRRIKRVFIYTIMGVYLINFISDIVYLHTGYKFLQGLTASYFSPFFITASISLFLLLCHKPNNYSLFISRSIGVVSSLTYGVYLIHTHPCIYEYLLPRLANWVLNCQTISAIIMIPVLIIGLFSACCLIDRVRQFLFEILQLKSIIRSLVGWSERIIEGNIRKIVAVLSLSEK